MCCYVSFMFGSSALKPIWRVFFWGAGDESHERLSIKTFWNTFFLTVILCWFNSEGFFLFLSSARFFVFPFCLCRLYFNGLCLQAFFFYIYILLSSYLPVSQSSYICVYWLDLSRFCSQPLQRGRTSAVTKTKRHPSGLFGVILLVRWHSPALPRLPQIPPSWPMHRMDVSKGT